VHVRQFVCYSQKSDLLGPWYSLLFHHEGMISDWFVLFECEDGIWKGKGLNLAKKDCNVVQSTFHLGERFQGIAICGKDDSSAY